MPLSGLSICAVGDRVVVRDGKSHWQVDNGQYVLGLDVSVEDGVLRVVERRSPQSPATPRAAEERGGLVRRRRWTSKRTATSTRRSRRTSRPSRSMRQNVAAWINWGRLLHEQGNTREAEAMYRRALEQCGPDPVLMFNLGVLLEDLGGHDAALEAYQAAIGEDPALADCHYNLARLYESLGQPQHAIRHLGQYRRLLNSETR